MSHTFVLILFGVATLYFTPRALQVVVMLFRLLVALAKGAVKWPGPRIHDPDRSSRIMRQRLGVGYENLFPAFLFSAMGALGAFGFSLLTFIGATPWMRDSVRVNWTVMTVILIVFAYVGVAMGSAKARQLMVQLNALLSYSERDEEPRDVDGRSTRAMYGIEHPLLRVQNLPVDTKRGLDQLYESVRCLQEGDNSRSSTLYEEAMRSDPSLHDHAHAALSDMVQDSSPADAGAIYYWLGWHSEYLMDWPGAVEYYEKAVDAFERIGYKKRASRACNNLGSAKMQTHDPSGLEAFERAIALDPKNGIAHINVGAAYYLVSSRGDPRFEKALDAFADAVAIDPAVYGSMVKSRIRKVSYTWAEDWVDIKGRVASRGEGGGATEGPAELQHGRETARRPAGPPSAQKPPLGFQFPKSAVPQPKPERTLGFQVPKPAREPTRTYRNEEQGFEIDIPKTWRHSPIPRSGPGDVAQYGCYEEAFNFLAGPLSPEPPLDETERDFRKFVISKGYTELAFSRIKVAGKEHVCASYCIRDEIGERWNKKYMIVLGGTEYTITGTSDIKDWFVEREQAWDAIVRTFRPL
jgi:tetratricopeptide (TPR) repeat protein